MAPRVRSPQGASAGSAAAKIVKARRRNGMPSYRVQFFKEITGDSGQGVDAPQGAFEIEAGDADRAVELAKQRFCTERGIRDWRINADRYEVRESRPPPAAR
jgi:hypothetical protein